MLHRFIHIGLSKPFLAFFCLCSLFMSGQHLFCQEETVKIKILAVNPSASQSLKTTVAQYLPPEVTPEDVFDREELDIVYDAEKKAYLLKKEVELKPQETQTIEIKVRNVWTISSEQLEETRNQLKQSLAALKKTKFGPTGQLLYEKAEETLSQIEQNQAQSLGVMQRIDLFRIHVKQLEDLKQNALSLEAMRKLESDTKLGVRQIKFKITAENPSEEEKSLQVRSPLPRDIQESDVLDKGDFSIIFDEEARVYVLQMMDTLGPKETRQYDVMLRDVWYIPQPELDYLRGESQKLVALFEKSPYEAFAQKTGESIGQSLSAITALQLEVESGGDIQDRMRAFVLNQQREKFAKRKFKELQDMLSEVALMPRDEKKSIAQRMIRKILDVKNRVLAAMGNQPQKSIYWWFFLGVVLFLAVITVIFYGVWLKRLKDNKWSTPPKNSSKKTEPTEPKP